MSFFNEIIKAAGLSELRLPLGYSLINYGGEAVYIEGMTRLLSVESKTIRLETKTAIITLNGENMGITELSDCLIVKGEIGSIEFAPHNNKKVKKHETE